MSSLNSGLAAGIVQAAYILVAALFIMGLKRMSSPSTARGGILWAGMGMVIATLVTYLLGDFNLNLALVLIATAVGGVFAWWTGKRVAMTDMPQMIALYNGMGG
ncbi:MAG: NAD(P)(+) transhydrogenase (Re/Si-specific) subunit beta, partial [Proteobacteria bacterium]|nr:NAD(P)(+) transhydrogenase (Re/Si-specific) subunit beta [Pseudomonadota bacterium]